MKTVCAVTVVLGVAWCLGGAVDAMPVNAEAMAGVIGGCTPGTFTEGKVASVSDVCTECVGNAKCDTARTNRKCIDLDEGDPVTNCGTCNENCGGTYKNYGAGSGCGGTFTTSNCSRYYTHAELEN